MKIRPTPKQHEAYQALDYNDLVKYLIFGGGAGGGKTWLGCEWLIKQCLRYPGTRWFIGREKLIDITASTYITFNKVCKHDGIASNLWRYNGQYHYIEFFNGSQIEFLDLRYMPSDPLFERYGSREYTGGMIEEAGQVMFGAFDVLKTRVGRQLNDKYNIPAKILITCNPKKNWLYTYIYKPWKNGVLPPEFMFIQSLVTDNPEIDKNYIDNLHKINNKALKQRLLWGNWEYDDDPAALMSYDAIVDIFTNLMPPDGKYITGDVARRGRDRMVIIYWEGMQAVKIYALPYEIKEDTTKSEKFIIDLATSKGVPRSHILLDEDGIGGGLVDHIGCKGFINNSQAIQPFDAQFDKTKRVNYANLKSQCYDMLAQKINNAELGVTESDPDIKDLIIEELEQVKQKDIDRDGKFSVIEKDIIKETIGRSPDFSDTLMMRMYFELNKEPLPMIS